MSHFVTLTFARFLTCKLLLLAIIRTPYAHRNTGTPAI